MKYTFFLYFQFIIYFNPLCSVAIFYNDTEKMELI